MAVVKDPLFSEEASGALGGIEYKTVGGRSLCTRRSISSRQQTPLQTEKRSYLHLAQAAWAALSNEEKQYCNSRAGQGTTGQGWYIACFIRLYQMGVSAPALGQKSNNFGDISDIRLTWAYSDPPGGYIEYTSPVDVSGSIIIYCYPTYSRREVVHPAKYRFSAYDDQMMSAFSIIWGMQAPVVHVRIDQVDGVSGELYGQYSARLLPTY